MGIDPAGNDGNQGAMCIRQGPGLMGLYLFRTFPDWPILPDEGQRALHENRKGLIYIDLTLANVGILSIVGWKKERSFFQSYKDKILIV